MASSGSRGSLPPETNDGQASLAAALELVIEKRLGSGLNDLVQSLALVFEKVQVLETRVRRLEERLSDLE